MLPYLNPLGELNIPVLEQATHSTLPGVQISPAEVTMVTGGGKVTIKRVRKT